jgi:hypothetical protein
MPTEGTYTAPQISTPDTPSAGFRRLYPKTDGWYEKDSAGVESKFGDTPVQAFSNLTAAASTNTTSEELLHSIQIPASRIVTGNVFQVFTTFILTNNANVKTARIYVNTSNSLSGATLIGTNGGLASSASAFHAKNFPVRTDTSVIATGGAATSLSHYLVATTVATADVTVPSVSAGFWILISSQKATGTDTMTANATWVRNFKT